VADNRIFATDDRAVGTRGYVRDRTYSTAG
jgi:hypothetical protein